MRRLLHKLRIKLGLYDLRKEGAKWVARNIGKNYVEEFYQKYDDLNSGIPIGNMSETIAFIGLIERVKEDLSC